MVDSRGGRTISQPLKLDRFSKLSSFIPTLEAECRGASVRTSRVWTVKDDLPLCRVLIDGPSLNNVVPKEKSASTIRNMAHQGLTTSTTCQYLLNFIVAIATSYFEPFFSRRSVSSLSINFFKTSSNANGRTWGWVFKRWGGKTRQRKEVSWSVERIQIKIFKFVIWPPTTYQTLVPIFFRPGTRNKTP